MSAMSRSVFSFVFVACLAAPAVAWAEGAPPPARPMMRVNLPVDLTVTGVGAAAWITTEILKSRIAPATCRWCSPPGGDDAIARGLGWDNRKTAATISDVGLFGVAPLAAFGGSALVVYTNGGTLGEWGTDALVILESLVVAADLTQIVKFTVGRERPLLEYGPATAEERKNRDNNLSFFSGHASSTFSLAVSSGMVASLKGYRAAPFIWATGLTIAATTGYLRIAADKHYFSDVVIGAIVGSAVGFVVPWLHRPRADGSGPRLSGMNAGPLPSGGALVGFSGMLD
ncbi:phosphatase PAP2 family protein [Polyangium spumosum]|uniref:Phosphatase PAP2 family protein n=1 Tax=Polyangium spumosum TaxID=889282 RepID=A0A6N7PUN3_9BACT|nr:phosphatase PAP2 family protein [Polyangium spumosum]MRG94130.1 phosphatase PAP2 family protein [Polyangium spumosum]